MGFIKPKIEYKIVNSTHPYGLTNKVSELIKEGWAPIGSHKVVETLRQNRYSGNQLSRTEIDLEYTQTLIKE